MTNEIFCKKLALERVQFQVAQLSALILSQHAEDFFSGAGRMSLKALLVGVDRDLRLVLEMLPDAVAIHHEPEDSTSLITRDRACA